MKNKTIQMLLLACMVIATSLQLSACNDDIKGGDDTPKLSTNKIAIIDAGSSGSRIYVYEVSSDSTINQIFPGPNDEEDIEKGRALSTVDIHPDSVKAYLKEMTSKYTPSTVNGEIPLYVLATAGMRLKSEDSTKCIYHRMLANSGSLNGFRLQKAMTISGRYEGLYAWIGSNYVNGSLYFSPKGIVEVGGASMQIAFASASTDIPDDKKVTRNGLGTIYCKSYLGGGANQIYANTPKTEPYVFNLPLEDDSRYYGSTIFYGCSNQLKFALKNVAKAGGSWDQYISTLVDDPEDTRHRYMMGYYLKWMLETLHAIDRISLAPEEGDWTEGAVYDIVINKQAPESFDYQRQL